MIERDLLLWVVGNPDVCADVGEIETNRILDLVSQHRVAASFLLRMDAERPRWAGDALQERLVELVARDRRSYASQLRLLRELASLTGPDRSPLIAFKGLGAYALTRDPRSIHRVLDLDLLAADPEPVARALTMLGFRQTLFRSIHEHAKFQRDSEVVDVHRYYPVYPDTAGLTAADLDAARHPGVWHTPGPGRAHRRITYPDLLARSTRPAIPGAVRWVVPDLETSALISCIDMFRDCAARYSALPKSAATLRLADVVDLAVIVGSDRFDTRRFLHLVALHDGYQAVRFAAEAARSFLGRCPAALEAALRWSSDLPVLFHYLWANCYPVDSQHVETMDDLLVRRATISELVGWLGLNVIRTGTPDSPCWYSTRTTSERSLPRLLCFNDEGRRLRLDIAAVHFGDVLELEVVAAAAGIEYGQMVLHMDFGRRVYEYHLDAARGQVVGGGVFLHTARGIPGASAWNEGNGVRFRARLRIGEISDQDSGDLHVLAGVRDREVGTLEPVSRLPMMMVPLRIIL